MLFKDFIFLPNVIKSIKELKKYLLIIISNQPDIAKGNLQVREKMNNKIFKYLKVDDIYICRHSREDNCHCRKPKVGLFKKAIKKYSIDIYQSYMIGDRKIDIDAGNKVILKQFLLTKIIQRKNRIILIINVFPYIVIEIY